MFQSAVFLRLTEFQGLISHDGVVPSDSTWCGGQRVGSTEQDCDGQPLVIHLVGRIVHVLRPVLTASRPSQTMAQMGPLNMSIKRVSQLPVYVYNVNRIVEVAAYR